MLTKLVTKGKESYLNNFILKRLKLYFENIQVV